MDFQKNDRVVYVGHPRLDLGVNKGELGTVLSFDKEHDVVFVRWDVFHIRRHTCDRQCEIGHGWNVSSNYIVHHFDRDLGDFEPNLAPGSIAELFGG